MAVWGKSREIHQVPTIVGQDPAEYGDIVLAPVQLTRRIFANGNSDIRLLTDCLKIDRTF